MPQLATLAMPTTPALPDYAPVTSVALATKADAQKKKKKTAKKIKIFLASESNLSQFEPLPSRAAGKRY
jgi:hypothetical protein